MANDPKDVINKLEENDLLKEYKKRNKNYYKEVEQIKVGNFFSRSIKRLFDILFGLIGIIILIPITIIVFLMKIFSRDKGPIFYTQLRIGQNGKIFKLYKFRSMVVGADKILKEYLAANPDEAEYFKRERKLEHDPRITKIGKILRETSLDEWPQFINIFIGNMSLVGPRPVVPGEIEQYGLNMTRFLSAKPGLTGYWQANGRSNVEYEERMKMELYYVDHFSLWLDIKIIFKTFGAIFEKEGAK